jgi:hypothetical protein
MNYITIFIQDTGVESILQQPTLTNTPHTHTHTERERERERERKRERESEREREREREQSRKLSQAEYRPSACNPQFDFESFVLKLPDTLFLRNPFLA